jgi:hypothetical protein
MKEWSEEVNEVKEYLMSELESLGLVVESWGFPLGSEMIKRRRRREWITLNDEEMNELNRNEWNLYPM